MVFSPPPSSDLIASLRARTASHHAQLDAALHFQPGAVTRARYVEFLRGTQVVLRALEPELIRWLGAGSWPRRLECLRADLDQLDVAGVAAPPSGLVTLPLNLAAAYGCVYVVEGSTLGGMVLAPIIERELGLPAGSATSYLRLWGQETAAHWRKWLGRLADFGNTASLQQHEQACVMACATFESYARALQQQGAITA